MLIIFLIKIILIFIVTLPITLYFDRWEPSKTAIVIITAIGVLITNFIVDYVDERRSTPAVEVMVKKVNNEYLVNVTTSRPTESIAIDLPVLGKIKNIHDNNSVTDARTSTKRMVCSNLQISQNNIEFYIENVKPMKGLEYKIIYEPMPGNISIAGTDRYKISYSWLYRGEQKTCSKWISLETGLEVKKPTVLVKGFSFQNKALSPEEIKKLYEEGLKKQEMD
ncbi:MAG: hypothetical protein HOG49_14825 [Candidatus Scalindua sp.]|nr:hypothetical protein [Candidatus Scalindua sp.]